VKRGELLADLEATVGARHEARFIVEEVLGRSPSSPELPVDDDHVALARALAGRRRDHEPLQYVLGHWPFRSLDLVVDPRVLVPRPETEQVVQIALAELRRRDLPPSPVLVDAGTGSGAIALSLALELAQVVPGARVWATDISPAALEVAAANLTRAAASGPLLPVTFLEGSWLGPLPAEIEGTVDLIVANPPYVATGEWESLPPDVRREPYGALVAGTASDGTPGLADVEAVLQGAADWLSPAGVVVVELAPHQAEAASRLATSVGLTGVRVEPDLSGRPRALVARTA
jgi:release factor glutamine methyltransferase